MGCGLSKAHDPSEVPVSHRNARTTFHARLLIVQRHQQGWKQAHIAKAMGISRKCVHTWISRYELLGEAGLEDRSSRRRHRCGPEDIAVALGLSTRTVSRVLGAVSPTCAIAIR